MTTDALPPEDELMARALASHQAGLIDAAEQGYRKVLDRNPRHSEALRLSGLIACQRNDFRAAVDWINRAIAVSATPMHYLNLGMARAGLNQFDHAIDNYCRALAMNPNLVEAQYLLGTVYAAIGKTPDALDCFRNAVARVPDFPAAHFSLGQLLQRTGQSAAALPHLETAARLTPADAEAHFHLGWARQSLGDLGGAARAYEAAVARRPDHAQALNNLGTAYLSSGHAEKARASYDRALAADPGHALAHLGRAMIRLQSGDWRGGWDEYAWRLKVKDVAPPLPDGSLPIWTGAPLHGANVVLLDEQGMGDALQFVRYASVAAERGGRVLLRARPALHRMLATAAGIAEVHGIDEPFPQCAAYAPLLSLPGIVGTTLDNVPAQVPYLSAEPARVDAWRTRIGPRGLKVGVCWRGSAGKLRLGRSFPLAALQQIADIPGVRLISLQARDGLEQLRNMPERMRVETLGETFDAGPDAFLDAAAVMTSLDLVITCDTSIAHLAGALGRPTWVALQLAADWRWLLDRSDSPWYPGHRLFRQTVEGDWTPVFAAMRNALLSKSR